MSDSLWPHGLQPSRLLCPWNSPGQNTRVGRLSFLQFIFLIQDLNWDLLYCRWILYQLSYHGSNSGYLGSILGQEDPLEEGMATHSSILAWRIPRRVQFGTHTHFNQCLDEIIWIKSHERKGNKIFNSSETSSNHMTRTCLRQTYYKSHTENDNISEVCYHYL